MTASPVSGGPAFPNALASPTNDGFLSTEGMTLLDYFATKAPISYEVACAIYGGEPRLHDDADRAAFFAVWAMARQEYASAMLAAREGATP